MLPAFGCNLALLAGRIRRPCEEALDCRARFGRNPCGHLGAARSNVPSSACSAASACRALRARSEEHTSELQSRQYLACRLLLEKKNTLLLSSPAIPIFMLQ